MLKRSAALLLCVLASPLASAQDFAMPGGVAPNEATLEQGMPELARQVLVAYHDDDPDTDLGNRYRLQLVAGQYTGAAATLNTLPARHPESAPGHPFDRFLGEQLYVRTRELQTVERLPVNDAVSQAFHETVAHYDDQAALDSGWLLQTPLHRSTDTLQALLTRLAGKDRITLADALELVRDFVSVEAYQSLRPVVDGLVAEDDQRRYLIQQDVLIRTPDGATLSAVVVRSRSAPARQPTALFTTVQTDLNYGLYQARYAAARGYVGVTSDTRGKRLSPDPIVLYEDDMGPFRANSQWARDA
jgi:RNA:NAD 2'-phosphotransferase (TPT1/KptA family)